MVPIPLSRFVIMRIISSLSFIASAIIVFIVKNKIEEKQYGKKMVFVDGRKKFK